MKTLRNYLGLIAIALLAYGCNSNESQINLNQQEREMKEYVEEHNIELEALQRVARVMEGTQVIENCTDCNEINFCGVDSTDLIGYINNYRDSVWSKTSPYFQTNLYEKDILFNGTQALSDFDARFLDMDLNKLENYICAIKNSTIGTNVNAIRFYYIRYDEKNAPIEGYERKHSMAMIPVEVDEDRLTVKEYVSQLKKEDGSTYSLNVDLSNFCNNTAISNHNDLCPPFTGCITNTLLESADTN